MDARTRESLGWGAVGALAFLSLALAYQLLGSRSIDLLVLLGVALVVFAATTGAAYATSGRLD